MFDTSVLELANGNFIVANAKKRYLLFLDFEANVIGKNGTDVFKGARLLGLTMKGHVVIDMNGVLCTRSYIRAFMMKERIITDKTITSCTVTEDDNMIAGYKDGSLEIFNNKGVSVHKVEGKKTIPIRSIHEIEKGYVRCYEKDHVDVPGFSFDMIGYDILESIVSKNATLIILARSKKDTVIRLVSLNRTGGDFEIKIGQEAMNIFLLRDGRIAYLYKNVEYYIAIMNKDHNQFDELMKLEDCFSVPIQLSDNRFAYMGRKKKINFVKIPSMPIDVRKIIKARDMHLLFI